MPFVACFLNIEKEIIRKKCKLRFYLFIFVKIYFSCNIFWLCFPFSLLLPLPPHICYHPDQLPFCLSLENRHPRNINKMQYSTLRKNKTKQTEDKRVKEKAQEPYIDIETHTIRTDRKSYKKCHNIYTLDL